MIKKKAIFIKKTIQRFELNNGKLKGNNREGKKFEKIYENFIENSSANVLIFGNGSGYSFRELGDNGATSVYKTLIVDYGYLGFILIIGTFIFIWSLDGFNRQSFIFGSLALLSIYQRPLVLYISYFILYVGGYRNCLKKS